MNPKNSNSQRFLEQSIHPLKIFSCFWENRFLIFQMIRKEVLGRYRGSFLGRLWWFFHPILLLGVYTFVFGMIFKSKWNVIGDSKGDFSIIMFSGMIVHTLFAECLNRAPHLMQAHANYVKKVVFPLEVLPWVVLGTTLFNAVISLIVLVAFYFGIYWTLPWTIIFFPIILFPFLLITMGFTWFLASLGIFIRDIGHVVGLATMALLFLSPVFYPLSQVPEKFRVFFYFNPLTFTIEQSRKVLLWNQIPNWGGLGIDLAIGLLIAWLGFIWFQKTRKNFADVL